MQLGACIDAHCNPCTFSLIAAYILAITPAALLLLLAVYTVQPCCVLFLCNEHYVGFANVRTVFVPTVTFQAATH
jgi:hypothetical protein